MIGILPPLLIIYIRLFVKEPTVWVDSRRQQTQQGREVMASAFVTYYANYALFPRPICSSI